MACIEAHGLRKAFGPKIALDGIDLQVEEGRILGLIGPNGAGKTTALNAILGLTPYQGQLKVLGREPWSDRDRLMCDVCFISDVAVLPRWIKVSQALEYVAGVHLAEDNLAAGLRVAADPYRSGEDEEYVRRLVLLAHNLAVLFAGLHRAQPGDLQKLGGLQILEEGNNA